MKRTTKKFESVTTEKRKSTFNGSSIYATESNSSYDKELLFGKYNNYKLSNNGTSEEKDNKLNVSICNATEYETSRLEGYDSQDKKDSIFVSNQNGEPAGTTSKFYNQFDEYWNYFPKTDYTYSPSSQFYRMEVAPGIPMIPNMSRRPLRSQYSSGCSGIAPSQRRHLTGRYHAESRWKSILTTIRTIITTTVTTTVTYLTDPIIHPTKSPLRTFLFLFILLALPLFYYLCHQDQNENSFIINESAFSQTKNVLQELIRVHKWLYSLLWETLFLIINTITMVPVFITQSYYMITAYLITIYHNTSQTYLTPAHKTNTVLVNNFKIDPMEIKNIVYQVLAEKNIKATDFDTDPVRDVIKNIVMEQYDKTKGDLNQVIAEANTIMKHHLKKHEYAVISYVKSMTEKLEKGLLEDKENIKLIKPQIESLEEKIKNTHIQPTSKSGELKTIENIDSYQLSASVRQEFADLIENALLTYHADRTGKADYALMSNGGMIISIKCTQTYTKTPGVMTFLGLNFYDVYTAPEVIIKPGIFPGECWAFEGSEGYVVIKLAIPVQVTAVTMEHTPKQLTPQGNIKSAPKQFSVWAVKESLDNNPEFLGRFVYLDDRASLQTFNIEPTSAATEMIELRIESNHGHPEYTCLYRFRVHGMPVN